MVHQFSCSACAFQVRSEDDDELIATVQNHARDHHEMELSPSDVRDGWEDVELPADD
jgi:predicted small metal-binding protein